jgi:hypothetical protein
MNYHILNIISYQRFFKESLVGEGAVLPAPSMDALIKKKAHVLP